jgi:hypothetical protein
MLTPKGYCQIYQIENYLLTEIIADFEDQVKEWIAQMEKYVENQTGKIFIADSVATVRKFQVESFEETAIGSYRTTPNELFIDECVKVDELKIDGEVIDTDDYLFYPANELPITRIKLTDDSGLVFTEGEQNIEVEAKWGYSVAVPNDISFATMVFVCGVINYSLQAEGEVKSETIGSYSVTYKEEKQWQDFERAKGILENYMKVII